MHLLRKTLVVYQITQFLVDPAMAPTSCSTLQSFITLLPYDALLLVSVIPQPSVAPLLLLTLGFQIDQL